MRRTLLTISLGGLLIYLSILFLVGSTFASRFEGSNVPLTITSVERDAQAAGKWLVHGSGFNEETKVVISPDIGNHRAVVETVPLWGTPNDLILTVDRLYVANIQLGVQTLDMATPLKPSLESSNPVGRGSMSLVRYDNRLYAASREGIAVFDMETGYGLQKIALVKTDGIPNAVQADGDILYVSTGANGIQIIDVSELTDRKNLYNVLSVLQPEGRTLALSLADNILYVATYSSGVQIYDVSDPTRPVHLSAILNGKHIRALYVNQGTLYVGGNKGMIQLFDMATPSKPSALGTFNTSGRPMGFDVVGDTLYVADGAHGLISVDIADPYQPKSIGTVAGAGQITSLKIYNDHVYATSSTRGLIIIDLAKIKQPQTIAQFDSSGYVKDCVREGEYLYLTDRDDFKVLHQDDNNRIKTVATLATEDNVKSLLKISNFVYLTHGKSGLLVADVSNPYSPEVVSRLELPGLTRYFARNGSYLLAASGAGGVNLVDISNPYQPRLVDHVTSVGTVVDVATDGHHVFVASIQNGIQVLQYDGSEHLQWIGKYVHPWPINGFSKVLSVEIHNDLLYVLNSETGLEIFDVDKSGTLDLVSSVQFPQPMTKIRVEGDYAYVSSPRKGVYLVDVSDKKRPVSLGCVVRTGGISSIRLMKDSLLLSTGLSGLKEVVKPIVMRADRVNDNSLRLKIVNSVWSGLYDLYVSNQHEQKVLYGVIQVD